MKGWMYILECNDGSYYTGSTNNLELRLLQHQNGQGANHTKKRLPVKLIYYEEYTRIDEAFYREKQVQGWGRKKKEALINGNPLLLPQLALAYRDLKTGGFESLNHRKESLNHRKESLNHRKENLSHRKESPNHRNKPLPSGALGNSLLKKIPWAKPEFFGNEVQYVTRSLESTWISDGAYLTQLEDHFKNLLQKKYALAVSNGTTALHLAYLGAGLKPGDEIIIPGFGFLAAANIALHMHLTPVFAEIDPHTWCLSAEKLSSCIKPGKTKAIVAIHTYGNMCDMNAIMEVAEKHGLMVIEDCAESLFSSYRGKYCGTFGNINTFSFQATKTITTGEGGLVVTDSEELFQKMALYRSHGMDRSKKYYWHELPGHNFRLTNFQAALGMAQLEKTELILTQRKRVYEEYKKQLSETEGVFLQKIERSVNPVIWAAAVKLNPKFFPQGRDKVIEQLKKKGIETRPGFYASSLLDIYPRHSLPVCEEISRNVLSLPTFLSLSSEDVDYICKEVVRCRKSVISNR